jgi:ABC-type glycerol-3-phosphate transport system permease component
MSIILKTEKKTWATRMIYLIMYVMLAIGASTMIYPFLLMVSGSFKSRIDANEFNLVPTFLHDNDMLFKKQQESKYNENLQLFLATNNESVLNFRGIEKPMNNSVALVTDWIEYINQDLPTSWYLIGYGPTADGKIIQRNERKYREFIEAHSEGSLDQFNERYGEPLESWFFLKFQGERLLDRTYKLNKTRLIYDFYDFKKSVSIDDRIYMSVDGAYRRYLKQIGAEEEELTSALTSKNMEKWVRTLLHPQYVSVSEDAKGHWLKFITKTHREIAFLNKAYGTTYVSFNAVPMPEDKIYSSAQLTDFTLFFSNSENLPAEFITLDTPEFRWRQFLKEKYGDVAAIAKAHERDYSNGALIAMPQKEFDHTLLIKNEGTIKSNFITRNFTMVFEYILLYGKGLSNTVIYCLASIILSLLINPIAAYALSRYKLASQFKILLFLIATMAFPAVVTMIPNFLLLRDLGLLNTFAALLLPSMANGYAVFLLKGFFDSLPRELYEAADIDGASEWNKFWMITMTLSKPILAVIALGAFNAAYANFMFAFILCQDREMWTLMVWLYQLQQFSSQGVVFASLLVAAVPTLLIFVLCQNVIMKGIVVPTEK